MQLGFERAKDVEGRARAHPKHSEVHQGLSHFIRVESTTLSLYSTYIVVTTPFTSSKAPKTKHPKGTFRFSSLRGEVGNLMSYHVNEMREYVSERFVGG